MDITTELESIAKDIESFSGRKAFEANDLLKFTQMYKEVNELTNKLYDTLNRYKAKDPFNTAESNEYSKYNNAMKTMIDGIWKIDDGLKILKSI